MRQSLVVLITLCTSLLGCGVSREVYRVQVAETERVEGLRRQEQARAEALQANVLQLLQTIEVLLQERERLERKVAALETNLAESETARLELVELNAQLEGRRARLSQLTQQLSDTWYDAAIDRARRALAPEPPESTAPGVEGEDAP